MSKLLLLTLTLIAANIKFQKSYPKLFTPNGDNLNDYFFVEIINPSFADVKVKIFSFGGEVVSEMKNNDTKTIFYWDGKDFNNKNVGSGIYFYQVESPETDDLITGWLILIR